MYVIDASVWVGRFLPDDTHNHASERWLGQVMRQGAALAGPDRELLERGAVVADVRNPGELPDSGQR